MSNLCTRIVLALALVVCLAPAKAAAPEYRAPEHLDDDLSVGDAAKLGWDTVRFSELGARIADGTYKNITSLIVLHRGLLIHEAYYNDGGRDRLNDMRSATKSVTSLLLGAAIDRGSIPDVKSKVYPYFRDKHHWRHPDRRKSAFTLEDLLTMSSLWECDDDNEFSSGNEERMYVTEDWTRFALGLPIKGFPPWQSKPRDSPFGRAYSYCTAGSFILGAVIERATREPLDRFAQKVLHQPLGIARVQWGVSPEGVVMGGGGTRYRSRDIAKIGEMVRNGGRWKDRQVISRAWIDASHTDRAQAREGVQYGYQWWHFHFPAKGEDRDAWAMSGNGGNYVFIMPAMELVTVITSTAYNRAFGHSQSHEIYREYVLKALP